MDQPNNNTYNKINTGVNICGFTCGGFGISVIATSIISALDRLRVPYIINSFIPPSHTGINNKKSIKQKYQSNIICCNPDTLKLLPSNYLSNKYNIGIWSWELETIPDNWKYQARLFDEIWVISDFMYNSLSKIIPNKIKKINIPIANRDILDKQTCKNIVNIESDEFLCLFIFDYLSDQNRKNPEAVIETFKKCFNNNEKCKLIIKSQNGNNVDLKLIESYINGDNRIIHISDFYNFDDTNILLNAADVYISLHRSEGLGLTLMESIILEKPVLCTNYSGNIDFCKKEWCMLVDYDIVNVHQSSLYNNLLGKHQHKFWADPIIKDAIKKLLIIYNNQEEYIEKSKIGKEWILKNYNISILEKQIYYSI